ncbi:MULTISPECIES: DinB family protein [unclassified Agrococcus]|uniref:mycothiol transferase n=1 Tax=unclassified Agrococcus TaxID=2615065 RepID=UPI00361BBD44
MDAIALLHEVYGRIPEEVRRAVDGLSPEQLVARPAEGANTIAWLVWHLARVQDHHVCELAGETQEWVEGGHAARFGLEPDADDTGYGHDADDVARVRPESVEALLAYVDAVQARSIAYLETLAEADLDRVVDDRWDPPVTLGVRLVSVADDDIQHAGQAAYVRGLLGA